MKITKDNSKDVFFKTPPKSVINSLDRGATFILLGKKGKVLAAGPLSFVPKDLCATGSIGLTACDSGRAKKAVIASSDGKYKIILTVNNVFMDSYNICLSNPDIIEGQFTSVIFTFGFV